RQLLFRERDRILCAVHGQVLDGDVGLQRSACGTDARRRRGPGRSLARRCEQRRSAQAVVQIEAVARAVGVGAAADTEIAAGDDAETLLACSLVVHVAGSTGTREQVAVRRAYVPVRELNVVGGGEIVGVVIASELECVFERQRFRRLLCRHACRRQQGEEQQRHDRDGGSASMSLRQRGLLCRYVHGTACPTHTVPAGFIVVPPQRHRGYGAAVRSATKLEEGIATRRTRFCASTQTWAAAPPCGWISSRRADMPRPPIWTLCPSATVTFAHTWRLERGITSGTRPSLPPTRCARK